jgi:YidC/Oxa1 family membrane protein insertase
MNESKNLLLAVILSIAVLFLWQAITPKKQLPPAPAQKVTKNLIKKEQETIYRPRGKEIFFENSKIKGSFYTDKLSINNLILKNYNSKIDNKDPVHLLNNKPNSKYFLDIGWYINSKNINDSKKWKLTSQSNVLTPETPLKFEIKVKRNVYLTRTIHLDESFLFTYYDKIDNQSSNVISYNQFGLSNKTIKKMEPSLFILHEGPIGVFNEQLEEIKYKKILKKNKKEFTSYGGWAGISDKYWLTAIVPNESELFEYRFNGYKKNDLKKFQIDFKGQEKLLNPGQSYQTTTKIFAGPKEIKIIDLYTNKENIKLFDRSIDFGILYFITKPIYLLLKSIYSVISNFGLAIICLTIIIRLALFPLASSSFKEISKIRQIHPEIAKIRKDHKEDKMRINREVMKLYKTYNIKPMKGFLPILIQAFVFFALYKVLYVTIDMRHAPFFGWIKDLTAADPSSFINLFGILPFDSPVKFGLYPLILGATMVIQQKLNPPPADPMQAKMVKFLPYFFVILFVSFPVGLVIYWIFNNSFSIAQQYLIMKKHKLKK